MCVGFRVLHRVSKHVSFFMCPYLTYASVRKAFAPVQFLYAARIWKEVVHRSVLSKVQLDILAILEIMLLVARCNELQKEDHISEG